ncbi:MAG: hypothetical protein ACYC9L_12115 [Sulfuricaulis sp.]
MLRTEALLACAPDGGYVCVSPLFVGDDRQILQALHENCGIDDCVPVGFSVEVNCTECSVLFQAFFNRPSGWRLKRNLKQAIGRAWNWQAPQRIRALRAVRSGDAGRATILASRLWCAHWEEEPAPATKNWLARLGRAWGGKDKLGFICDGAVCVDASALQIDPAADRDAFWSWLVARLIHDPILGKQAREATGMHYFRLEGDPAGWLDESRPLRVVPIDSPIRKTFTRSVIEPEPLPTAETSGE